MANQRNAVGESSQAGFERDFGYLDKFLVALRDRAETFDEPRRERFLELLDGLPERFAEIRSLLTGSPDAADRSPPKASPSERKSEPQSKLGLTVGSLLRSNRVTES